MASQFPTILSSGAIARYPLGREGQYSTRIAQMADFSEQRFQQLAKRLMTWDITLSQLTDSEFEDILAFFDTQAGSYGTFTFIDPFENLLQYSEAFENATAWNGLNNVLIGQNYLLNSQDFEQSSWQLSNAGASNPVVTADAQTAPDGTATADTIAFPAIPNTSGDDSIIFQSTTVPPATASMSFTFSVWLKVASGTGTINIAATNGGAQGTTTVCSLTTSWQRFSAAATFNSSPGSTVVGEIFNPQNSAAITVWAWGAQLEYGTVASDYTPTTTATAVLQIADPNFIQAPTGAAGSQWNLNSLFTSRARQLVVTGSADPHLRQTLTSVLVGGSGSSRTKGITVTGSYYYKLGSGSGQMTGRLISVTPGDVAIETFNFPTVTPTSSWQRNSLTATFAASDNGTLLPSIDATVLGTTIYIFGAQLEAEGTASAYKMTTNVSGVHTKAHIHTDEFAHIASEFNVNVFENSMRQRRSTLSRLSDVLTIYESA